MLWPSSVLPHRYSTSKEDALPQCLGEMDLFEGSHEPAERGAPMMRQKV